MPQLYFTLNMKEITKDYTIPSFVWLARPGSWNWDNLPENVYAMPNVDKAEVLKHDNYDKMVQYTDAYIEELYSINPNAKLVDKEEVYVVGKVKGKVIFKNKNGGVNAAQFINAYIKIFDLYNSSINTKGTFFIKYADLRNSERRITNV